MYATRLEHIDLKLSRRRTQSSLGIFAFSMMSANSATSALNWAANCAACWDSARRRTSGSVPLPSGRPTPGPSPAGRRARFRVGLSPASICGPTAAFESLDAELQQRRRVRQLRHPRSPGDRKRPHAAALDRGLAGGLRQKGHLDVARDHRGDHRRVPAIGNMQDVDPGRVIEDFGEQMQRRAEPARWRS